MSALEIENAPSPQHPNVLAGERNAHNAASFVDLTGQVFGRLIGIRYLGRTRGKNQGGFWLCRCSCDGNERDYRASRLRLGHTRSCGCLRREVQRELARGRADAGALAKARREVARISRPKLTEPVAIYEMTDPRGLSWIYVGASATPVSRYSAHCSASGAANFRLKGWITELRDLGLRPDFKVRGWVERAVAGGIELQAIAEARAQFKWHCLNAHTSPAYGRIYELKPKHSKPTYGVCRTAKCIQTATHSTGWCDSCFQMRIAARDNAARRAGHRGHRALRGSGTGLCHDCRDPIPLEASRCPACSERTRLAGRTGSCPLLPPRDCVVCAAVFRPKTANHVHCSANCSAISQDLKANPLNLSPAERRKTGGRASIQYQREHGTGFFDPHTHTHEQRVANGLKGGRARQQSVTQEQRVAWGRQSWITRREATSCTTPS